MLPVQFARNDPSLAIKRENGKRGPHNNDRLASSEFDDDFGGAYSLPSKKRHEMLRSQHPVELRRADARERWRILVKRVLAEAGSAKQLPTANRGGLKGGRPRQAQTEQWRRPGRRMDPPNLWLNLRSWAADCHSEMHRAPRTRAAQRRVEILRGSGPAWTSDWLGGPICARGGQASVFQRRVCCHHVLGAHRFRGGRLKPRRNQLRRQLCPENPPPTQRATIRP